MDRSTELTCCGPFVLGLRPSSVGDELSARMDALTFHCHCVVVTSVETNAFMAIVAYFDKLMKVTSNLSARSRKEGTEG